ncbi:glycero-beta-D-manno-heptose-1,7-bisphosphate 7-phosphatase [Seminavis robusta]|uniref:D,D-heptose 1,7-bisphosphate phosphatase n=1 Tax=Seminavis robusta TaxID=568900 RepID=A0A9N8DMJ3_9STRA|nr:glycero-beta-D-manno-heptose-1,7-bisphosphate 7-phosphatase [Seminavis robusta]|eukprot:Sro163_g073050.1 glycero-beta-D-manno-heptose-1,7-bisphosphate 7-phosphatase (259) ;mRNA; r:11316-12092
MSAANNSPIGLILLDRDGVINEDVGAPGVIDPQQLELTHKAGTAIGNLKRAGYPVVLITNQSCVGKQLITEQELYQGILPRLQQLLLAQDPDATWDHVFCCTTTPDVPDERRKPSPGMILEACRQYKVDPSQTVFVGDTLTDLQAATRAGVPVKILVSTGYGSGIVQQYYYGGGSNPPNQEHDENDPVQQTPRVMECSQQEQEQNQALDSPPDNDRKVALQSVMPFLYVKNLFEASQWILEQQSTAATSITTVQGTRD